MGEYHSMSPSTPLPVHKGAGATATSHAISRTRPKIKIIHIIAPEIIKTDVANFRELVQRLTGKPTAAANAVDVALPPEVEEVEEHKEEAIKKRPAPAPAPESAAGSSELFTVLQQQEGDDARIRKKIKCEVKVEEGGFSDDGDLDHGELWMDLNPVGFLSFLEEDVFQGMMAPDLFQPLEYSSRMDLVGEMYAS